MVYNTNETWERSKQRIESFDTSDDNKEKIVGFIEQLSAEGISKIRQDLSLNRNH